MAATVKPSLPFGATEWSHDWSTANPQTQLSWGTWEAPVASPAPAPLKTPVLAAIVPPAPLPSAAFVPLAPNNNEDWNVAAVAPVKVVAVPVVQSPPVIAPSSFVDVNDASAWTVPEPTVDEGLDEPRGELVPPTVPPLSSPQRAIKLRQAGGNIEAGPDLPLRSCKREILPNPIYPNACPQSFPSELRQQDLYKTEFCRSWRETGACRYGNKCQFAHGEHELRPVLRHPKYKTEICRNFSETGTCPYGTRCRFVHYQRGRSSNAGLPQSPSVESVTLELADLALEPAAVAVAPEEAKEKSKGSRLPFFQKLRRNASSEKEKDKEATKGR